MYARRFAVVVGVRNYAGGLSLVDNAANDAARMHAVMSGRYGFEARLLSDSPTRGPWSAGALASAVRPTNGAILDAIGDTVTRAAADDLFVFYYAGHGDRRGHLLPSGADRSDPATYLNYAHLFGRFGQLPCRHVIAILDCCYAAGAVQGATHASVDSMPAARDRDRATAILYSTTEEGLAPDSFVTPGTGVQSLNSPFTQMLAAELENAHGVRTIQDLLVAIRDGLPQHARLNPGLEIIGHGRPRWPETPIVVRSGGPSRRWVSVDPLEFHVGHAETATRIYRLSLLVGQPAYWALERPSPAVRLTAGGELLVRPEFLEIGANDVAVSALTNAEHRISSATLRFIRQAEVPPLRIASESLEPCFVGERYRCRVHAEGGLAPYEWDVDGLPNGLTLDRSLGWIVGRIDRGPFANERVSALVRLTVSDSLGASFIRMVRLAVVNPEDYCEVPAGPCVIGPTSTSDASAELRRRFQTATVTLPRFFIKRFPVTEREWNLAHGADSGGRLPATGMTYVEAVAFCKRRGTRLPNRFEWEKAARGEDGFEYPWGASFDADLLNGPLLWWGARTRVDQFPEGASPYGVMDMAGNVQELVRDRSVHGPEVLQRVRGGSFRSSSLEFSTWAGFDLAPGTEGGPTIGFRDVIEAHDAPVLPQGFVNVAAGKLRRPDGTWERWPSFDIARYAVSNLEYEEFVTATGAPRPSHWPFDFDDRYLPVVNVPVDAAKKFCEWKTARIHRRVRPLTPSIWRAAALVSGTGVQRFPWGADYVPYWCNARDSGWGGPVRVFEIADGRSPCGAFNLVGNVYEWCGNAHVIGGSWRSSCVTPDIVKAADGPKDDIGFRYWAEIHAEPRR